MACRSIDMAKAVAGRKGEAKIRASATLENPPPSSQVDHLSSWELPEMCAFLTMDDVNFCIFNTCAYQPEVPVGKRHFKPQKFAGSLLGLPCDGGHQPIVGREASKASAEYLTALCQAYARSL